MLGPEWMKQRISIRGAELTGWSGVVKQVDEVRGGLVIEAFISEEKDFVLDALWDSEPVEFPHLIFLTLHFCFIS